MKKCLISNNKKFQKIITIKKMPIFMGTFKKKMNEGSDLNIWINKKTGNVQVYPKANRKKIYRYNHNSGTVGNLWKKHHIFFYNNFKRYIKGNILEIGGGDNSILLKIKNFTKIKKFISLGKNIKKIKKNKKVTQINKFFSSSILKKQIVKKYDLIIHSHLFEHVYQPNAFLNIVQKLLKVDAYHCFSIPNQYEWIKMGAANAVNFEHPYYYDLDLIKIMLKRNGFKIIKIKKFFKHSILLITKKIRKDNYIEYNNYNKNLILFQNLKKKWNKDKEILERNLQINRKVFLFGAHVFSQLALCLLDKEYKNKITGIIDNDIYKNNKYLYGTKFKVMSPHVLKKFDKPYIFLRAGPHTLEIKKQCLKINKESKFI